MAIEAPLSSYKRNTLFIMIAGLAGFGLWCIYDGYINQAFIQEHTNQETNEIDSTLKFNRDAPPFLIGGAILVTGYWFMIRRRKLVATDSELIVNKKLTIPYDTIQAIDKTHYSDKGFFDVLYQDGNGKEAKARIDDRQFDQLQPILDHLITQIT